MTAMEIVPYKPDQIAEFGSNIMEALVASAAMAEEAQKLSDQASRGNEYISFELTKAVFDFHERFEDVDIYAVFSPKAKDVEHLNRRVLVQMGVLKRVINKNDEVEYHWTSERVTNLYEYTAELKEKDPAEYTRRFNNRKRLNAKLSEAYKAACALSDQGLKPDDLFYSEDPETKQPRPTIRNAPKQIAGDKGEIQLGGRKTVAGATMTPTMSSLVKIAAEKHKPDSSDAKDNKNKGEERDGHAKMGMSDEDFGSICNTLIRSITAQELEFSADKLKHLQNVQKNISDTLKKLEEKAAADKAAAEKEAKKQKSA